MRKLRGDRDDGRRENGEKPKPREFRNPILMLDASIERSVNFTADMTGIKKSTLAYTSIVAGSFFSMLACTDNVEGMKDWLSANLTFSLGYCVLGAVLHKAIISKEISEEKKGVPRLLLKGIRLIQTGLAVVGIAGAFMSGTLEPLATTIFDFGVAIGFYLFGNKEMKKEDGPTSA